MTLIDQLDQDMKAALKNKEKQKVTTIRMLRAAIKKMEIDKQRTLSDDEVIDVLVKDIKQRNDAIHEYEKAGRSDLVQKEQAELRVLTPYLPEQFTEDELRALIQETINTLGVSSKKEMGKVMGALMPKIKGKADGKQVNRLVQELLS